MADLLVKKVAGANLIYTVGKTIHLPKLEVEFNVDWDSTSDCLFKNQKFEVYAPDHFETMLMENFLYDLNKLNDRVIDITIRLTGLPNLVLDKELRVCTEQDWNKVNGNKVCAKGSFIIYLSSYIIDTEKILCLFNLVSQDSIVYF